MRRFTVCAFLLAAGCAGSRAPAPVTPAATAKADTAAAPHAARSPAAEPAAPVVPPIVAAPALTAADTSTEGFDRELADELRLSLDSAADAEALERLADAEAEADVAEDAAAEPGGANAVENAVTWDIDVASFASHTRVQYWLDFFQGPARERFGIWLTRLPRYERMIRSNLEEAGLPSDMVYLAMIESGYSNSAVSRAKAVGMWQFMKATAQHYGLRVDRWVDERRDPFKATRAAVRFLRDLRDRFGSLYLAAAAYNAGPGGVSRGLRRLDDDEDADTVLTDETFFRLYDTKILRQETRDYVPKLIAAALIAKEPERYGFPPPAAPPEGPLYDSIVVSEMTGLDVIARLADTTVAAIRELNPQYLRLATPPGARMVVRLPPGKGERTAVAYAALPASQRVSFREHHVTRGETLSGIAKRYGVSVAELRDANPTIRSDRSLRAGQNLVVPTAGTPVSRETMRLAAAESRSGRRAGSTTHRVRPGESLWSLARRYDVTVEQLRAWNGLSERATLRAGERIRIGGAEYASSEGSRGRSARPSRGSAGTRTHLVRPGDTLSELAERYGVSVTALRRANGLGKRSLLKAGKRIVIPG